MAAGWVISTVVVAVHKFASVTVRVYALGLDSRAVWLAEVDPVLQE